MNRTATLVFLFHLMWYAGTLNGQVTSPWVDSVFAKMTFEEKIGQLFIIRAHSDLGEEHERGVLGQIQKYHVGGLCFFQGTPEKQTLLTNRYQKASQVPLIVSMDAEWGLGMRLKDKGLSFPRQLMLGAVRDVSQIESMGYAIGLQLKAIGVNMSFSPVADININPDNPVIGDRSFGEDRAEVAQRAIAYMRGLEAAGVMACGKHFPGHGDTDMDSHLDLPDVPHDMERLKNVELYPFQQLINAGLKSIMVAHLHVDAIDSTPNISTTLSPQAIEDLLIGQMGFDGLVITDGLEMKGVTKNFKADEIAIMAFAAGNDLLLLPDNIDLAFSGLKKAFAKGLLSPEELDKRVKKILKAKYELGLNKTAVLDTAEAKRMAFDPRAIGIKQQLIEYALTVVQNKHAYIPIVDVEKTKYATVAIGSSRKTKFQSRLDSYLDAEHFQMPASLNGVDEVGLLQKLKTYDRVIVSLHGMNAKVADNYGLTKDELRLVQNINRESQVILVVFGNPYTLKYFENIDHLIMAYEDNDEVEDLAAQGLLGVFGFKGQLPVTASNIYPVHQGFTTPSLKRLGYAIPERVGMCSDSLEFIKNIVDQMIRGKAAPGCEVLIAREGRIVYEQAFGYHTYTNDLPVKLSDLYDLASVTKVTATTPSVMRLEKEGLISIHKTLGDYLPWLRGSNKQRMVIDKVMAHHAGLQSWIPFYQKTIRAYDDGVPEMEPEAYCDEPSLQYCLPVANGMYADKDYIDSIHYQIYISPLNRDGTYVYSDLGFIMLSEIIQRQTGARLDHYADSVFYKPLGLHRMGFLPLNRFSTDEIVPSEVDTYYRCQVLDGYVHDMGSALMGGVSGHAGNFSDAEDLAVLFQMYMNGGVYGGKNYIDKGILDLFTTRYGRSSRRGIGFDMKELEPGKKVLTAKEASASTYGHTGFTGTCVWNDPDQQLTYIFLSNRTYPTMRNGQLMNLSIRERIHSRAYKAIEGFRPYKPETPQG